MGEKTLPEWPSEKPEHLGFANALYWERYERARADAAMARLRYLVGFLNEIGDGDDWVRKAVDRALSTIGELPKA